MGPMWILFVQVVIVSGVLAYYGYELRSWVLPVTIGLYIGVTTRSYIVALTNRRFLLIRLSSLVPRRFTVERDENPDSVTAELRDRLLNDRLDLKGRDWKLRLQVPWAWGDEGVELVRRFHDRRTVGAPRDESGEVDR